MSISIGDWVELNIINIGPIIGGQTVDGAVTGYDVEGIYLSGRYCKYSEIFGAFVIKNNSEFEISLN